MELINNLANEQPLENIHYDSSETPLEENSNSYDFDIGIFDSFDINNSSINITNYINNIKINDEKNWIQISNEQSNRLFYRYYVILLNYVTKYKIFPDTSNLPKNFGIWFKYQKKLYKNNKMNPEHIKLFSNIYDLNKLFE